MNKGRMSRLVIFWQNQEWVGEKMVMNAFLMYLVYKYLLYSNPCSSFGNLDSKLKWYFINLFIHLFSLV